MPKKCILAEGTEIRISAIGYYDFWYPVDTSAILKESVPVEVATTQAKLSRQGDYIPYVVSGRVAKDYGSPINILWARK